MSTDKVNINVLLVLPDDVSKEREIILGAIERLGANPKLKIHTKIYPDEETCMSNMESFHIVVIFLWQKIGKPLDTQIYGWKHQKEAYISAVDWIYHRSRALHFNSAKRFPLIYVYQRTDKHLPNTALSVDDKLVFYEQRVAVANFFKQFYGKHNAIIGTIQQYSLDDGIETEKEAIDSKIDSAPKEFERNVRENLDILTDLAVHMLTE